MSRTPVSSSAASRAAWAVLALAGCSSPDVREEPRPVEEVALPALDDEWLGRIDGLPPSHAAAFDFDLSTDVLGSMVLNVVNDTTVTLRFVGGSGSLGRAVYAEVPIAPEVVATLVGGGDTGWFEPTTPVTLRSIRDGETIAAPVDRIAFSIDSRGLAHVVVLTSEANADTVHVYGRLVGGCETTRDDIVRRVAHPEAGSLCAEVLSL